MSDVKNDVLEQLERAVMIYGKICDLMEQSETDRVLLEKPRQKMRWAIGDLIVKFHRSVKEI